MAKSIWQKQWQVYFLFGNSIKNDRRNVHSKPYKITSKPNSWFTSTTRRGLVIPSAPFFSILTWPKQWLIDVFKKESLIMETLLEIYSGSLLLYPKEYRELSLRCSTGFWLHLLYQPWFSFKKLPDNFHQQSFFRCTFTKLSVSNSKSKSHTKLGYISAKMKFLKEFLPSCKKCYWKTSSDNLLKLSGILIGNGSFR